MVVSLPPSRNLREEALALENSTVAVGVSDVSFWGPRAWTTCWHTYVGCLKAWIILIIICNTFISDTGMIVVILHSGKKIYLYLTNSCCRDALRNFLSVMNECWMNVD